VFALGLAHYRAGDFERTALRLEKMYATNWRAESNIWLVLAMAHYQQGSAKVARGWLDKALKEPVPSVHPHETVIYQLLSDEAKALFDGPPPKPGG
jgi:hypothetical protein